MTRSKEEFKPLNEGKIGMYTCGPTVYNFAHIGNFRAYIFEDLLRRYLKFKGYQVTQVMNFTDVDDKTIRDSMAEGTPLDEFTRRYKDAFLQDVDTLNIERAEIYPEATMHIPQMVDLVKRLQMGGYTYEADGSIYFRISSYNDYGKLAHLEPESMQGTGRVDHDEYEKDDVRDFALWKAWVPEDGDVYWETELGKGRPGWHIECSAMSTQYLGTHFDIHTGGVDNRFPHHENEIAQSVCGYNDAFVNTWLHCEFLLVDGKKMSKSLGNFYTLRGLIDMGLDPVAIRYALISVHYRMKLNFTIDGVRAAASSVQRIRDFRRHLDELHGVGTEGKSADLLTQCLTDFEKSLDDDLNIAPALGALFTLIREINRLGDHVSSPEADQLIQGMERMDQVLGFLPKNDVLEIDPSVMEMVKAREDARANRDWARADELRDQILEMGYFVEDSANGSIVKKKL